MFDLICLDSVPNLFGFIDTQIAPPLLYYAYIPVIFLSLLIGFLVVSRRASFKLPHFLLFALTVTFSLYTINEMMLWVMTPASLVKFGWELIPVYIALITLLVTYFSYVYIKNHDVAFLYKFIAFVFVAPIILLLPTTFNTTDFDLIYCEPEVGLLNGYLHFFMLLGMATIAMFSFHHKKNNPDSREVYVSLASITMLLVILFSDFFGDYTGFFEINLIEPVGMLLLIATLSYMIVRFKAFNIKLAGAQALVFGLIVLIGSEIFFVESTVNKTLVIITFILSCLGGYFLVRSVKKEIAQREQLEVLTKKLARANERLKQLDKLKSEFVSIASHQLRSPLTSMRGYASMLVDGTYGTIPEKAKEAIQRIADSSALMARSVENYLNVSRIESGNMKYEMTDFNLKDEVSKLVDDKRQEAMKKGLLLTFKSEVSGKGIVNADIGKAIEIVHNLINNSVKYTPKGSVEVFVHDDKKQSKIYVDIIDTGIGMTAEDIEHLFGKFSRATNANSVNVSGTGLGLYVARMMAVAMKGDIKAFSDGPGKGSTFRFELPEVM